MGDVGSAVATPFVAIATTLSGTHNDKIYYDCPRCHEEVWVYGSGAAFAGRRCNNCRSNTDFFKTVSVACSDESASAKAAYYTNYSIVEKSINCSDKIVHIRVRSIWIHHGSISAVESVFTGIATGSTVTHWWVEIETENSSWYCAQWKKPDLVLSSHDSRYGVAEEGKSAIGAEGDSKNITNKHDFSTRGRTIGDLRNWMNDYHKASGAYDVVNNNC
eukprot:UN11743